MPANPKSFTSLALAAALTAIAVVSPVSAAPRNNLHPQPSGLSKLSGVAHVYLGCYATTATIRRTNLAEHKVVLTNTTGRTLRAGTRIYFGPRVRHGAQPHAVGSVRLTYDLAPGMRLSHKIGLRLPSCTAWVNLRRMRVR